MRKPPFKCKRRSGEGTPLTLAIVLVLIMLFCAVSEFARLWIISQGVKEAAQQAVISALNDNYDDVYHAVREGYAAGWSPEDSGGAWNESLDEGNVYGQMSRILGLNGGGGDVYTKLLDGQVEYAIYGLDVELRNNGLASGQSQGYTAAIELKLNIPVRFLGDILPSAVLTLHTEARYIPLF